MARPEADAARKDYIKGVRVGGRGIQDWASFSEGVSGHSGLFARV